MKKKIAVFANGWNSENLYHYMQGIKSSVPGDFVDFFVFLGHDSLGKSDMENQAESSIYFLPDLKDYDGIVFFGAGMNFQETNKKIFQKCKESGLPLISICYQNDADVCIHTDNYSGMKMVADHLIEKHGVRNILFIAGPKDNEEANARLNATIDSCKEHGVDFSDKNILYANWEIMPVTEYIVEHFSHGEELPDVIMCVNDATALFVSLVLADIGKSTPEDVLITGFDGTDRVKYFYPTITSVEQPFFEMAEKTYDCFKSIFNGKQVEKEYYIPCKFSLGESCGCDMTKQSDERRRLKCRIAPQDAVLSDFHASRVHYMEDAVLKSDRYSTLSQCLQDLFYSNDSYEGNPFFICMDPLFAKIGERDISEFPKYTINKNVDLLVGKSGDKHFQTMKHNIDNGIIPEYDCESEGHIYVVMPIYTEHFVCGYMVMSDHIEYFEKMLFSQFKQGFNRILETYRKNLQLSSLNSRLSELLNKDPMTSTRNRVAYENYKKGLQDIILSGDYCETAFIMFDVNNLKIINDSLGHESGDEYIKKSCAMICNTFKHSPVFRIGGDEFVAVLQGEDFDDREALIKKFRKKTRELAKSDREMTERLSVACGMAVYDEKIDANIDETIKRADEEMYADKKRIKGIKGDR